MIGLLIMAGMFESGQDVYKQQVQALESMNSLQQDTPAGLMGGRQTEIYSYVNDFVNYLRSRRSDIEVPEIETKPSALPEISDVDVAEFEAAVAGMSPQYQREMVEGLEQASTIREAGGIEVKDVTDTDEGKLSNPDPLYKMAEEIDPGTIETKGLMYREGATSPRPRLRPTTESQFDMPVFNKIVSGESKDYNTIYSRSKIKTSKPLTEMTVGEVRAWQDKSVAAGSKSSAAGRFQIIRKTLDSLIDEGVISKDDIFDEETQNKAFLGLLDRRNYTTLKNQIQATDDPAKKKKIAQKLQNNLAMEFASIPVATAIPKSKKKYGWPKVDLKPGDSFYKDPETNLNAARHSAQSFLAVLLEL